MDSLSLKNQLSHPEKDTIFQRFFMNQKLESILARLPHDIRNEIEIAPLGGGMTNQIYQLHRNGETFVLRVFGEGTELLGINRHHERICAAIAAQTGVGAEVLSWIPGDDILLTRFIAGKPLTAATALEPAILECIVSTIHRCHEGLPFPGYFSPFRDIRAYCQMALERGVALPASYPNTLAQLAEIEIALGAVSQPKACHNDLLASNFINDGQSIKIIDWEFAAMGDPFFDLGLFAADFNLDANECEFLLHCYFGTVRQADLVRLHLMRMVGDLRESFCPFLLSAISKVDCDYIAYGNQCYERFLRVATSSKFGQWLQQVA